MLEIVTSRIGCALAYCGGSHTPEDIAAAVEREEMQLWEGDHSAIITEIRQTPRQKILLFFLASGRMDELKSMVPPIMAWGKSIGCDRAQLIGRKGWSRSWLVQDGWKETSTVMEKEL